MPIPALTPPPATPEADPTVTRDVVLRYHAAWKAHDAGKMAALFAPDALYQDHFQNRRIPVAELQSYLATSMPIAEDETQQYLDRLRVDGDTAFLQYRVRLGDEGSLLSFHVCESFVVRDGRIVMVREYATLTESIAAPDRPRPTAMARDAAGRLGLSARQLAAMSVDLEQYFLTANRYLDPTLDLQRVATDTGYTRNQVSFFLNRINGESFYRHINRLRLAHLMGTLAHIRPGTPGDVRMEDLARQSGFRSLSTFYRCFRQETGLPPKTYIAQLLRGEAAVPTQFACCGPAEKS